MSHIQTSKENNFLKIQLNRPEKGNAINPDIARELKILVNEAGQDKAVHGLILCGSGKNFCTGADLQWIVDDSGEDFSDFKNMYEAFLEFDLPIVGKVHGQIMGAGLGLTCICDIVVCDEKASFSLPEARWGLIPGVLTPLVLRKLGPSQMAFRSLTGRPFSAEDALSFGVVHVVSDASKLDQNMQQILIELEKQSLESMRTIKKSLRACQPLLPGILDDMTILSSKMKANPETIAKIQSVFKNK